MSETHLDVRILKNTISIDCHNPYDPNDPIGFSFSRFAASNGGVGIGVHLNESELQEIVERHGKAISESVLAMNQELIAAIEEIKARQNISSTPTRKRA